jgi:hypothetical protein
MIIGIVIFNSLNFSSLKDLFIDFLIVLNFENMKKNTKTYRFIAGLVGGIAFAIISVIFGGVVEALFGCEEGFGIFLASGLCFGVIYSLGIIQIRKSGRDIPHELGMALSLGLCSSLLFGHISTSMYGPGSELMFGLVALMISFSAVFFGTKLIRRVNKFELFL